jgi:hypothetical protein
MEHQERADELEREADAAAQPSEKLEREIEETRTDWEAKKSDQQVPGAVPERGAGPHQLEGEEDPATGDEKADERQEELEDAAQSDARSDDDDSRKG